MTLSKVLNRSEIGMGYDNVAEFKNAIRDELSEQMYYNIHKILG